jgi:ankyrin repeat protein
LVEKGAPIDVPDANGTTALIMAAEEGEEDAVKILLDHGANVDTVNKDGETAMQLAREWDNDEVVELLKQAKGVKAGKKARK